MKNMAVLIDTNILLNYITNREDTYLDQSTKIVELCAKGIVRGYLKDICEIFTVASASQKEILDAIEKDSFKDFLQQFLFYACS